MSRVPERGAARVYVYVYVPERGAARECESSGSRVSVSESGALSEDLARAGRRFLNSSQGPTGAQDWTEAARLSPR